MGNPLLRKGIYQYTTIVETRLPKSKRTFETLDTEITRFLVLVNKLAFHIGATCAKSTRDRDSSVKRLAR